MIKTINGGESGKYGKDFMKVKLNSDDGLPLNKQLKFHAMTIVIRPVFQENGIYYPQFFLDECCMSYKNVVMWKNWYFRRNWY